MTKYSIGIDYGTQSVRGVLVDVTTGEEKAVYSSQYENGVLDEKLPTGEALKKNWALQVPSDYINSLKDVINNIMDNSFINRDDVIGLGIDFTASTVVATDINLEPLCNDPKFKHNPNSYVKLWKHHAAQKYADEINNYAIKYNQDFLKRYGGKISSEWLFPKILQVIRESPEIYEETAYFVEAGDWLVSKLVGKLVRSTNTAGFKAIWHHETGYPDNNFLKKIDPYLDNILNTKLSGEIKKVGERAGYLSEDYAELLNLSPNTAVAVNIIDAHAANAAVGAINEGDFVMALGTSTCQMLLSKEEKNVKGIAGYVKDGIIPGYFSYETGQAAVGDSFSWFIDNLVSQEIEKEAISKNVSTFKILEDRSSIIPVGENKLIALDWWNGSRSDLKDSNLSGLLVGLTLKTKPEDIFKALIESTAFGTKLIIQNYQLENLKVNKIFACGGLPSKNKLMIQIYSDVLNMPIYIASSDENTALGSAIYGALAAGKENYGYDHINEAVKFMSKIKDEAVTPNSENNQIYEQMFITYKRLHDIFGEESNEIMYSLSD